MPAPRTTDLVTHPDGRKFVLPRTSGGPMLVGFEPASGPPAGAAGSLTTRTSNVDGTATLSPGHGITTGARLHVYWSGGSRYSVVAGTVSGNAVPFSGGLGDNLPLSGTAVSLAVPTLYPAVMSGDDMTQLIAYSGLAPGDLGAVVSLVDPTGVEVVTYRLTGQSPTSAWLGTGTSGPAAGKVVVGAYASQGNPSPRKVGLALYGSTPSWTPSTPGGLLAEYDFLKGASESSAVLYDRKPSGGANGTVGAGATYSALGLTNVGFGGGTGFATSGVAGNAVGTVLVYLKPLGGPDGVASNNGVGVLSPLYLDFVGGPPGTPTGYGDVWPRLRDMNVFGVSAAAHVNAPGWPLMVGWTMGNPVKLYLNGAEPLIYDAPASNGSDFIPGSSPIDFGGNVNSTGQSAHLYCYALLFSTVLSAADVRAAYNYMTLKVAKRSVPAGGPVTYTNNFVVFTGNSITNRITLPLSGLNLSFDQLKVGFGGASLQQVILLARQATQPIRRPLSSRNFLILWPFPTGATAADVGNVIVPYAAEMQAAGWTVGVPTCLSYSTDGTPSGTIAGDAIKNAANNALAAAAVAPGAPFTLIDLRVYPDISADGAANNTQWFVDRLHPTISGDANTPPDAYGTYIQPALAAWINSRG